MKSWRIVMICAAIGIAAPPVHAEQHKRGVDGRYEGVVASPNAVWVVDTRTGRVRKCTQEFADQTPVCSKQSN